MKKFVFWAMMTLGVVGLQSCDKDDDDRLQVSANLQEAFDTRYPNVSRVDWEQKGQFYEAYLEDGTLIREEAEWGEHTPVTPGQTSEVKELVKTKYPQAVILDIEEEKGGIEVEISDGGRQKEVYYKLADGVLSWMHTTYEIEEREYSTLPEGVRQALADLSGSGMEVDDVDFFETETGNYYRIEVEDRGADKYVYVAENGEMLQMKLKNYA